jgi:cation diffusion facilitator CzcD-associated flavoprotein CzcO
MGRPKSFADGPSILKYINEAADEYKVRDHSHLYQQRALSYNFDTKKLWTVTTVAAATARRNGLHLPVYL